LIRSKPRGVVLFHAYEWDDYTARQAARLAARSDGLDFIVAADESNVTVPTGDYGKLSYTDAGMASLGLPAHPRGSWWNLDYVMYEAARQLPDYEYYLRFDPDVLVTIELAELVDFMHAAKTDWLTLQLRAVKGWAFERAASGLPYADRKYVPLMAIMLSYTAIKYLEIERHKLADAGADPWPFCECFIPSAAVEIGIPWIDLRQILHAPLYSAELALHEDDERLRDGGSLFHAVLDLPRYRKKVRRMVWFCLNGGFWDELLRMETFAASHGFGDEVAHAIEDAVHAGAAAPPGRVFESAVPAMEPAGAERPGDHADGGELNRDETRALLDRLSAE